MAYREDRISLRKPKILADGRLRFDGALTRTGVFEYIDANGSVRREYRPPEEVFKADSLATFEGLLVTDEHPPELINPHNAATFRKGQLGESVRKDGRDVVGTLYIDDPGLTRKMQDRRNPKNQLSVGYRLDIEETPGTSPDGKPYDVIQRNIRANHLAVVYKGRAGTARVRMDSAEPFHSATQVTLTEVPMSATNIDSADLAAALTEALAKNQTLTGELATATKRADSAEGRVAGLETEIQQLKATRTDSGEIAALRVDAAEQKARADKAESAVAELPAAIAAGVKTRMRIERGAVTVMGKTDNKGKARQFDDLNNRAIMELALEAKGVAGMAERSDAFVEARFDAAVESSEGSAAMMADLSRRTAIKQEKAKMAVESQKTQRKDAVVSESDRWKGQLPSERHNAR